MYQSGVSLTRSGTCDKAFPQLEPDEESIHSPFCCAIMQTIGMQPDYIGLAARGRPLGQAISV